MPRVANKLALNKSGCFVARKRIPEDVQSEYERLYGVKWEARFTAAPGTPLRLAQAQCREWLTQVEARIANIRADRSGQGQALTPKDARALAGEWYHWFVERKQLHPQPASHWEWVRERVGDEIRDKLACSSEEANDPDIVWGQNPKIRVEIRPLLADQCETAQFLSSRKLVLDAHSRDMFLDALFADFSAALDLLARHAKNDFTPDTYPLQFPKFTGTPDTQMSAWHIFERWVDTKKPARATVDRWRGVFLLLAEDFSNRSASSFSTEEIQEWVDGLVTSERTPRTARDVWIVAGRTVFGWAKDRKLIVANPFTDVKVSVPRGQVMRETKAFRTAELTTILRAANAITDKRRQRGVGFHGCAPTRVLALAKSLNCVPKTCFSRMESPQFGSRQGPERSRPEGGGSCPYTSTLWR
jgi:hypothetical protein